MAIPIQAGGPRPPRYYGAVLVATLRVAVGVIRPRHDIFDRPVDDAVVVSLLSFTPYMPRLLRVGFALGLAALEYAPVLFGCGLVRFSSMTPEQAAAYLERWRHGAGPISLFFESLRELVLCCFYQQPEILEVLGVDWQGRADELVERRARLQGMSAELANPRNAGADAKADEVSS